MSESRPVCELSKNAREKIVFSLTEFRGRHYLDMRVHVVGEDGGQDIITRKGLTLRVDFYPQFKVALGEVEAGMMERGLLDPEDLSETQG